MSQAFIREGDDQWLNEIPPTMTALIGYLTRENGGIRVYETGTTVRADGTEIHHMSNGLSYAKNDKREWVIVES